MKIFLSKIKYFLLILFCQNFIVLNAEDLFIEKRSVGQNEILIESNNQRSDLKNSIFYAEGNVIITNTEKEFISKSNEAIFYKLSGKIKLIGDVEVTTSDSNKLKAGEILYFLDENRFEAISDSNQRVNTKFVFSEDKNSTEQIKE